MSIIRSDNRLEEHPKPVQEYERRFTGVTWVDWASFAEMELVYNAAYRLNKYFWVAGIYYQCYGTSLYRAIGGVGTSPAETIVLADASGIFVDVLVSGETVYTMMMCVESNTIYTRYQVIQDPDNPTYLDFTNVGGVYEGQIILTYFK
jgi:hypothetical protein